jgi:hypothetical protein
MDGARGIDPGVGLAGSGLTWLALDRPRDGSRAGRDARRVLTAHVRGLMAPSPADVLSTDATP